VEVTSRVLIGMCTPQGRLRLVRTCAVCSPPQLRSINETHNTDVFQLVKTCPCNGNPGGMFVSASSGSSCAVVAQSHETQLK
jgi:hypothetical protein